MTELIACTSCHTVYFGLPIEVDGTIQCPSCRGRSGYAVVVLPVQYAISAPSPKEKTSGKSRGR